MMNGDDRISFPDWPIQEGRSIYIFNVDEKKNLTVE